MLGMKAQNSAGISIAVVGAGWNGIHIARSLTKKYPYAKVDLYEASPRICNGLTNKYGSRTHRGGCHYPRSKETRVSCAYGYDKLLEEYPDLLVDTEFSIYGLAKPSDDGRMPRISQADFMDVFDELKSYAKVNQKKFGLANLQAAVNIEEPTFLLGEPRRKALQKRLNKSTVNLMLNTPVIGYSKDQKTDEIILESKLGKRPYKHVINTTCFKALVQTGKALPFNMSTRFQLRLSLIYEDTTPPKSGKPISFIALDGLYISLLPINDGSIGRQKYMLTHGKHTTLGAYSSYAEATSALEELNDNIVYGRIRPMVENDPKTGANHFIPGFSERFKYKGYSTAILPAIKTEKDFRSAVVFQDKDTDIISIFPGKLVNVFETFKEVCQLLAGKEVTEIPGYRCATGGSLLRGKNEITEKVQHEDLNTCSQQTLSRIQSKIQNEDNLAQALQLFSYLAKVVIPIGVYNYFQGMHIGGKASPIISLCATCIIVVAAGTLRNSTQSPVQSSQKSEASSLSRAKKIRKTQSSARLFSLPPKAVSPRKLLNSPLQILENPSLTTTPRTLT